VILEQSDVDDETAQELIYNALPKKKREALG